MRVLVSAVGKRTEHWEGLFQALVLQPELELDVLVADVTTLTTHWLDRIAREHPDRFRVRVARHLIGEERTGHMASITYAPGAWHGWPRRPPDVLHLIGEPSYLSSAQAITVRDRRWPSVPISHYAAQNIEIRFPTPFPWLEQRAYRKIALAFPITHAALAVLRAKGYRGDAKIVPLGVALHRFTSVNGGPDGPFTVGFVGRLEAHKGIADLLAAGREASVRLLIVGDGSLRGLVEQEAAARPGEVELVPWSDHDELPGLLHRMHVLALPSIEVVQRNVLPWMRVPLREQFGRVLVEAMACGVPCVASRVGEMGDVVGDSGLLVEPGSPRRLAEAISHLREDRELLSRLRAGAVERAGHFGWEQIAKAMLSSWHQLKQPSRVTDISTE